MRLLVARYVAPMTNAGDAEVIEHGGVLIDGGTVVAVGSAGKLRLEHAADVEDVGDVLLTPGLVNAHTHLELSDRPRGERPASFGDWIGRLAGRRDEWQPEAAAKAGIAESLRHGVTCVGDISQFSDVTRPVLAASHLRGVSYAEVLGLGKSQAQADAKLQAAVDARNSSGGVAFGITPHAPYTVNARTVLNVIERRAARPIAMHLAESPEEAQFIRHATGPLREIWDRFDAWTPDAFEPFDGSPIAWSAATGLLEASPLLAHVNYLEPGDLELLASSESSVAYCPRTHEWFGHPQHPMERVLDAGINVCLATDSRATSPDLNVMDDARLVFADRPHLSLATVWAMITWRGAAALGVQAGSLRRGWPADVVAWPVAQHDRADPLREILTGPANPVRVWAGGVEQSLQPESEQSTC